MITYDCSSAPMPDKTNFSNKEELWNFRKEITLGSPCADDYINTFGVEPFDAVIFFEEFLYWAFESVGFDQIDDGEDEFAKRGCEYDKPDCLWKFYKQVWCDNGKDL